MSENKKYYYLKLKENFFNKDEVKLLEQQENGFIYSNLYLKLCLMSLKGEGRLLFRNEIPYDEGMISAITNVPLDNVRAGLVLIQKLGLIKFVESGEIYMTDIQDMIGHTSSEGERKKLYRERLKTLQIGTLPTFVPETVHQSKSKSKSKRLEIESYKDIRRFDEWYNLYNKKRHRADAVKEWHKLNPDENLFSKIIEHTTKYIKVAQPQYRPDPERYIKNKRYEDEIIVPGISEDGMKRLPNGKLDMTDDKTREAYLKKAYEVKR